MLFRPTVAAILFAATAIFSQAVTVFDRYNNEAFLASPSFSDPRLYNSYDFCESPAGLLDRDSLRLRLAAGLNHIGWEGPASLTRGHTSWSAPDLYVGVPKTFFARLYYAPTRIAADFPMGLDTQKTTLPLQAFGMTLAGQAANGLFLIAFQGKGYLGDAEVDGSADSRTVKGLEDLSVTVGSRIHRLLAIGMSGGVRAQFDSLRSVSAPGFSDRCFDGQLPMLGWNVDFGNEEFPVQSALSVNTATHRFVYVSADNRDRDPIKGDSLAWKWQTSASLRSGSTTISPALLVGYWRTRYQPYAPTEKNDNLDVGPIRTGDDRTFKKMYWGPGVSASLFSCVTAWTEYTYSSMDLVYGSGYVGLSGKKQGYHRTVAGVDVALHSISRLSFPQSIETFLRVGWMNVTRNSGIDPEHSREFGPLVPTTAFSRMYRYAPDFGWGQTERTTGLIFGIGGRFLSGLIETDVSAGFLNSSLYEERSGLYLRAQAAYALRG